MSVVRSIPAWLLAAIVLATPIQAIRFDWTKAEIECAATLGIELDRGVLPRSSAFVRYLAWISDLVAVGRVVEIREDPYGAYHTLAEIEVEEVLAGTFSRRYLVVAYQSGPAWSSTRGVRAEMWVSGERPPSPGERHVFFLTRGFTVIPGDPERYALPEDHFRAINGYEFRIVGTDVVLSEPVLPWKAPLEEMRSDVARAVTARDSQCAADFPQSSSSF